MKFSHMSVSWYTERIARGEPFSSLLFGDGEFNVILGRQLGQKYTQYNELVTAKMQKELRLALGNSSQDVLRCSDVHLLNWRVYRGQDIDAIKPISEAIQKLLEAYPNIPWYDGVVWDTAAKTGQLAPFLREVHKHRFCLIGNDRLSNLFPKGAFVPVPCVDAYGHIDGIEKQVHTLGNFDVYMVCMGLGAIPLIMRLRQQCPKAIFLDLGSTFDVLVRLGEQRGWRNELYANPAEHKRIVDLNLEDVC